MSSRSIQRVGVAALASILAGGILFLPPSNAKTKQVTDTSIAKARIGALSDLETNRVLAQLAKQLAVAVDSAELRQTLHGAIDQRFDGDENALWSSLAEDPTFNRRIAGVGRRTQSVLTEADEIARIVSKIPRLQIAVPANFESWNPATYKPLVAYFPQGVDDTTLETISAYDSQGNSVQLDAQAAPEQPVIVIGLNERTDEEGNLVTRPAVSTSEFKTARDSETAAAKPAYGVRIRIAHLINDHEPWPLGDAEIGMRAKSRGCSGVGHVEYNWANLENDDDWWAPGAALKLGTTRCPVGFAWWEDDGGRWDFTLTINGYGVGIGMDDDDDMIGRHEFRYNYFAGQTLKRFDWNGLHQWVD